jgi:fucose permease
MGSRGQTSAPLLMVTACAGLFTFGVTTSFLGATLPELSARAGFDLERQGALFSFLYLPQVPMVFLAGPLIDRFGKKIMLASGFLLSAAALVGMAYVHSYSILGALLVILGLGSCSAMSAANTLIPDLYPTNPSSALNLGNTFFGVGAFFFPLLVTTLTRSLGLTGTMYFVATLVGLVAFVALAQTFPPAGMAGGFDWKLGASMIVNPAVIILAFVLVFYAALEISTAGWIRTFLERDLKVLPQNSKIVLTAFWIMMMLGRLAASQIVKRVCGSLMVVGCAVGAILGLVLMALAKDFITATIGIVIVGLTYAPVFPTTAGTASTYFPRIFGTVFGLLMTFALLSGAVVPRVIGNVAQHHSVRTGIWILVGAAFLFLATQLVFVTYERKRLLPQRST